MVYKNPNDTRQKEAQRRYYLKNKQYYLDANKLKRQRMRLWLQSIKDNKPCTDCHIQHPYYVLDFDHREPSQKKEILSRLVNHLSWKRLKEEVSKCDLVCANCHRKRTFDSKVRFSNPEGLQKI